ncbi:response regulator [Halopiger aswanensis]|uniref:Response regulator receiver domain-containing protein n=1 Tax=Halopiger aswanensis TaxID=148449 RepID=A0A419WRN0_9EURY|nr:response regulator [Halopiger aswanensis]RKD98151.1 response regulator receiver domain-containing protein [Halopiger aswanensis]
MDERTEPDGEILLVEDNPGDVRLVEESLRETPGTLHTAVDGEEALDFLSQRGDFADAPRPDIVLLDLNLPRVDGTRVLDEIRSDLERDGLRVVVLTSLEAESVDLDLTDLAEVDFYTKPTDPDEFMALVRSVVFD